MFHLAYKTYEKKRALRIEFRLKHKKKLKLKIYGVEAGEGGIEKMNLDV